MHTCDPLQERDEDNNDCKNRERELDAVRVTRVRRRLVLVNFAGCFESLLGFSHGPGLDAVWWEIKFAAIPSSEKRCSGYRVSTANVRSRGMVAAIRGKATYLVSGLYMRTRPANAIPPKRPK